MSPVLAAALLILTIAVIFVNGWTDAPNAITCAVSSGALTFARAVRIAAVCNLLGIAVMGALHPAVTDTMTAIADFDSGTPTEASAALCAAMASIVLFAVAAWKFGIPTSESHALIAALTGASLALGGVGIDTAAWAKVLWGLVLSLGLGLLSGLALTRVLAPQLKKCPLAPLRRGQIAAAAGLAFMHGAQDGLKFVAVLVTADRLVRGDALDAPVELRTHGLAFLLCAAAMALGTCAGGKRIVQTVGGQMVALCREQNICADLAGGGCLLAASLLGIPMSTTHTKTTAMMGAGLADGQSGANGAIIRRMLTAWAVTFPVCGVLGFVLTRVLLQFG